MMGQNDDESDIKIWDFSTKGFIYYDLNKAGLFVNLFQILQRTLKPEKIIGAYWYHLVKFHKFWTYISSRINQK